MPDPYRPLHPDFEALLTLKDRPLVELFLDLRAYLLELHPDSNELLYHTHALSSVFSLSEKLSDAYCHIPIYQNHLNLGFNQGALLPDPHTVLRGTGKLIRHIPLEKPEDYRKPLVKALIEQAIQLAQENLKKPSKSTAQTISKIKK